MSRRLVALAEAASAERPWATPRYLRRLVASRRIPFHKIAGRIWFDVADLDEHEEARRVEPPALRQVRRRSA